MPRAPPCPAQGHRVGVRGQLWRRRAAGGEFSAEFHGTEFPGNEGGRVAGHESQHTSTLRSRFTADFAWRASSEAKAVAAGVERAAQREAQLAREDATLSTVSIHITKPQLVSAEQ